MTANHSNEDNKTVLQQDKTQRIDPLPDISDNETHEKNALPIGTILEDYEVIDIIGWGGFGIVYLANDNLGRKVAIKEYMPASLAKRIDTSTVIVISKKYEETFLAGLRSFVNEARLLAQFDHPSLIEVFRFWESNGTAYMAMPFYQGETLKETLRKMQNPPEEAWLKSLLEHLIDAIDVLHKAQCFHRDISPDNILILPNRNPILLDFGAARHVINDMTHSLTVILKPGFAPIEQYGEIATMKQGAWTDIYALAAVIYLAITGKTPVPSVSRVVSDTLVPISELAANRYSTGFLKAIDIALSVRPEDRPQNVEEFRNLLGLKSKKPDNRPKDHTIPKNHPKKIFIFSSIVLLAFAVFIPYIIQDETESTQTTNPTQHDPIVQQNRNFTPLSALNEILEKRDINHAVSVSIKKAKVRIGLDPLQFSINSSRNGYVYLLMVGTNQTDFYLLFPNKIDSNNMIKAGIPLNLPRPNWKMLADGPPGTNHFAIIVSDNQRDFSLAGLTDIDPFAKFPFQQAKHLYQNYSGIQPLFAGKAICPEIINDNCSDSYGAAVFSIEEVQS
ncbi:serine/threonine-protein kinase [Nitrosomonas sp.]|uniref:serine/threonine-protein kinase n=1 Tax=Nitrosomonas sp. TaxID=42353 RepID=UPI00284DD4B3|nr:serine/threonine-protein kinase [Nitrosomonas sp.]MDR4515596.1 serine/threonine-protein kinase [Nitrosomonas sp.]